MLVAGSPKPVVLVADDDAATRCVIASTLVHEGFTIMEATSGQEAIAAFKNSPLDAILMDVEMPEMDGYQACEIIRHSEGGADLPIVMVTGHDDSESIDRAFDIGATDFISKPINWSLIGHRLRYILRGATHVRSLGVSEAENRALIAAIPDSIFIVDEAGCILNHLSDDSSGDDCASGKLLGENIGDILPAELRDRVIASIRTALSGSSDAAIEYQLERPGDEPFWYESRFAHHVDGKVLVINREISERKHAENKIHQLAYYDLLTGLPNRALLKERCQAILRNAAANDDAVAIFNIDLDRFKRINDTLGSSTGDAVLVAMATRLSKVVDELHSDMTERKSKAKSCLAGIGGDEFALVLSGSYKKKDFAAIAEHIGLRLAEPLMLNGHEFVVTGCIGVATCPENGTSLEVLLKKAESARGAAKRAGRNSQQFYRSSMNSGVTECLNLENELRRALENDELSMFYQPKYHTKTLRLAGAEALLRWHHPQRGSIPPSAFIPIAEESGLITDLGRWVAKTVCQQISYWDRSGVIPGKIAINVSGQEFGRGNLVATLTEAVRQSGINASALELEITETVLMGDIRSVTQALHALREEGFSLAVDDFGTGYSSLQYLQKFPIDVLKIDSSFVQDVEDNTDSRAICTAVIALARGLGLTVVAEGVETFGQLNFLKRGGCDTVQGFLMSEPLSATDYFDQLRRRVPRRHLQPMGSVVQFG